MNRVLVSLSAAVLIAGATGCQSRPVVATETGAQIFEGLGGHARKVTTDSREAQRYFDQGLTWAYAFNHDEAIRSFGEAARLDPECAMAWWGVALCNGPHINNPVMSPESTSAAWAALQRARTAKRANATERALIEALSKRYADPASEAAKDRAPLDAAYAAAMREVWRAHPHDADIGCLFAESMMDLRPWDLWTKDGQPQPGTEETVGAIEAVLKLDPDHPGANHLYIHAVEASPRPERALAAAERLRTLAPASGHLVHMPSHIDIRVGEWEKAAESNRRAILADAKYREASPKQAFYRVYMAHNHHFLAFTAMMNGRSGEAQTAARDLIAGIPQEFSEGMPALVDPLMMTEMDVLKRYGRWRAMLGIKEPAARFPISRAMWRFNRGVARAALGEVSEARAEQAKFREAASAVSEDAMMAINKARTALEIAEHMLEGEILLAEGNIDAAIARLRQGVAVEDTLRYMEPPDWLHPVRHPLGAALAKAGRHAEAEEVYRADLRAWPENGWSLRGLANSLRAQGKVDEASDVERRFRKTWARADVRIGTSCLCVAGE